MPSDDRQRRLEEIYSAALQQDANRQDEFVRQACGEDVDLRCEIESLLGYEDKVGDFLQAPALEAAARSMADSQERSLVGRTLGPYSVMSLLGVGGMGEVYAARDTRLGRMVAIKILPSDVAQDPERKRRFLQEARAASALNHPNIVTLHDVGSEGGVDFLVMEYVRGKTLSELIPPKGLGIKEALQYALEIAGALAKAHAAGIIHRDLKSGNVMVTDGVVKVLDFGLAKLTETAEPGDGSTAAMTSQAMIVGTAAYMSPEQAQGKPVDARTDIFSFGVMLYEMLTGRRPFQGANRVSTLAAILEQEPKPLTGIDAKIPRELERVVLRCLRKDPERRFQGMADVRVALAELREEAGLGKTTRQPSWRWALIGAGLCAILAVAAAWVWRHPAPKGMPDRALTRLTGTGSPYFPAISPDGRMFAYTSNGSGSTPSIWVQQVLGGKAIQITHEPMDGFLPVFSPDGTMIAFKSHKDGGGIYEVPALGGEPRLVVKSGSGVYPGAPKYTPDGLRILYANEHNRLCMVPREGGKVVEIQPELEMMGPHFFALSPDGKEVLTMGFRKGRQEQDLKRWWLISVPEGKLEDVDPPGAPPNQESVPVVWVTFNKREWVIFNRRTGDSTSLFRAAISRDGKVARDGEQLTLTTGEAYSPTVSEADQMMFSSVTQRSNVWSIPIDANRAKVSGERQRLTQPEGRWSASPSISRDGRKVATFRRRTGLS